MVNTRRLYEIPEQVRDDGGKERGEIEIRIWQKPKTPLQSSLRRQGSHKVDTQETKQIYLKGYRQWVYASCLNPLFCYRMMGLEKFGLSLLLAAKNLRTLYSVKNRTRDWAFMRSRHPPAEGEIKAEVFEAVNGVGK